VGDAFLGEWEEYSGYAFHIRRRLDAAEQAVIGEVCDIRGTPEARRRLRSVRKMIERSGHRQAIEVLYTEAGTRIF
jgi:hypothetical protein